jgi:hypothetical protein
MGPKATKRRPFYCNSKTKLCYIFLKSFYEHPQSVVGLCSNLLLEGEMTEYFIREMPAGVSGKYNARGKAREDMERILVDEHILPVDIQPLEGNREHLSVGGKLRAHLELAGRWRDTLSTLQADDILFIQFPVVNHTISFGRIIADAVSRGVKIVLIIHDIDYLRYINNSSFSSSMRINREEVLALKNCSCAIVHNNSMRDTLLQHGVIQADRVIVLGLFDYLLPRAPEVFGKRGLEFPVAIAGNLTRFKAAYLYQLPDQQSFALYGAGYEGDPRPNIEYKGAFLPDEIPQDFDASFGLVWDGDSTSTCSGEFGSYLRINNPHKASLYLAIGLPVIVWQESALAPLVVDRGVGMCVSSIDSIPDRISELTASSYRSMCDNAKAIACDLRCGRFTHTALAEARNHCCSQQ